jgi:16S rRNA (guanine527-N7)-methyltransferase
MDQPTTSLDLLQRGARELRLQLRADQLQQFARYQAELLEWNERFNLTAITNPADVEVKHFLDSLTLVPYLEDWFPGPNPKRLVDVGAGAGFPGLPIAITLPHFRVTMVEATAKKCRFLEHVIGILGLANAEVRCGRAEDLARDRQSRARFDIVVARAVASLPTLLELTMPFARVGGLVVAMKKADIDLEIKEAAYAIRVLGGKWLAPLEVQVPLLNETRLLVRAEKVQPTPAEYPRRSGKPTKAPLSASNRSRAVVENQASRRR